jgi:aspartate ammonia-lyase
MTAEDVARVLSPERLSGITPMTGAISLPHLPLKREEGDLT